MDLSLTRSNVVSLAIASICLILFAFFPTGENVLEDIACMISFFILLPILYVRFILKAPLRDFEIGIPSVGKKNLFAISGAAFIGVLSAVGIFFTPYNTEYTMNISPVFTGFRGFTLYHIIFILPSVLLVGFFSVTFVKMLELPRFVTLLFGGFTFSVILISLFTLPPIAALFFILPFFILWYFRSENLYFLTLSVFLSILTYNTMIAKALLT